MRFRTARALVGQCRSCASNFIVNAVESEFGECGQDLPAGQEPVAPALRDCSLCPECRADGAVRMTTPKGHKWSFCLSCEHSWMVEMAANLAAFGDTRRT